MRNVEALKVYGYISMFSHHFHKGKQFVGDKNFPKRGLLLRERICS